MSFRRYRRHGGEFFEWKSFEMNSFKDVSNWHDMKRNGCHNLTSDGRHFNAACCLYKLLYNVDVSLFDIGWRTEMHRKKLKIIFNQWLIIYYKLKCAGPLSLIIIIMIHLKNIQNNWIWKINKIIKVLEIFTYKRLISFDFTSFEQHQTRTKRKWSKSSKTVRQIQIDINKIDRNQKVYSDLGITSHFFEITSWLFLIVNHRSNRGVNHS